MARIAFTDRLLRASPFVYLAGGLLTMFALRNSLAVFSGLLLMAAAGIELLRRARFQRELAQSESRMNSRQHSRMSRNSDGDST